jgi:phenylalanyl-tRNA synthetase beta chain
MGLEINITPGVFDDTITYQSPAHRPDLGSIMGFAREAGAAFDREFAGSEPMVADGDVGSIYDFLDVDVWSDKCNRFSVRMAVNVRIAPSPNWLQARLVSCGITPVNNVTDLVRYVCLEYGQPIIAIDYQHFCCGSLMLCDEFVNDGVMITDGAELSIPISSDNVTAISDTTTQVIFAAANLNNFKGDPMLTLPAVQRVCQLVQILHCGEMTDGVLDLLNYVPQPVTVPLETSGVSKAQAVHYLHLLGIPVKDDVVTIPSFRPDLRTGEDIAREIQRIHNVRIKYGK